MNDTVKITAIVTVGVLVLLGGAFASCTYSATLDARAPVVETCIKHPSTRSPFREVQR